MPLNREGMALKLSDVERGRVPDDGAAREDLEVLARPYTQGAHVGIGGDELLQGICKC